MATKFLAEQVTQQMSRKASEALVAHRLVEINAADHEQVDQADAANDKCVGIVGYAAVAGQEVAVKCGGHLVLEAGGTVAVGDEIVADSVGRGVARGVTATTLYNVVGRALTAAASGEHFMVAWGPYGVWGANAS